MAGSIDRNVEDLERRMGELQRRDPAWLERLRFYRRIMGRYSSVLYRREQAAAARRLADAAGTAADRIRATVVIEELGLEWPPETEHSRAVGEAAEERYERWKARQADYFDENGIPRHLLEGS